jgi:hypothetical protein
MFRVTEDSSLLFFPSRKSGRLLLRLQTCGKPLRLGDPLDLDSDGINRGFDSLEPAINGAQLSRGYGPGLEPPRQEPHDRESQNHYDEPRDYPGKDFVNDEVRIRWHFPSLGLRALSLCSQQSMLPSRKNYGKRIAPLGSSDSI